MSFRNCCSVRRKFFFVIFIKQFQFQLKQFRPLRSSLFHFFHFFRKLRPYQIFGTVRSFITIFFYYSTKPQKYHRSDSMIGKFDLPEIYHRKSTYSCYQRQDSYGIFCGESIKVICLLRIFFLGGP